MANQNTIELVITTDAKGAVTGVKQVGGAVTDLASGSRRSVSAMEQDWIRLGTTIGGIVTGLIGLKTIASGMEGSLRFLGQLETSGLGIASAYMTGGKYIDETTGKVLQGAEALKAAQQDSKQMLWELQAANFETIATLDQLVRAYQETLPVAMAKGFNKQMAKDFTLAMVQAAGAIGLPLDQMGEETRSLLTGTINPRTSRIATVLGLRNEDIRQMEGDAQRLFDFLMTKLDAYKVAGIESQNTWAGLWSNTTDIALQAGGMATVPLFEGIKGSLKSASDYLITIDEKTKTINWNPEFLNSMEAIKESMRAIMQYAVGVAAAADIAGTYAGETIARSAKAYREAPWIGKIPHALGELLFGGLASDDLSSIDVKLQKYADIMARIDKLGSGAAAQGSKAGYIPNPAKQTEEQIKAAENWAKKVRDLETEMSKFNLSKPEQEMLDVQNKAKDMLQEIGKAVREHGTKLDTSIIGKWEKAMIEQIRYKESLEETKKIIDAMIKADEYREGLSKSRREFDLTSLETENQQRIKIMQMQVSQGYLPETEFIKKRNLLEEESLLKKQANINALMMMETDEAKATQLWYQYLEVEQKIKLIKEYEVFELADVQIKKQNQLNELVAKQFEGRNKGYNDSWQNMMGMANQIGGTAGQGMGKMASSVKGIIDISTKQDPYTQQYQAAVKNYEDLKALSDQAYIDDYTMMQSYNQMKLAEEQMYQQQKLSIVGNSFGAAAGLAQAFYAMSGSQNRAAFEAYKGFATAEAIITGIKATINAYEFGNSIGGPVVGGIMAAIAAAETAVMISSIQSQQLGGGVSTAAMPSSSGGYSYSTPTTNTFESTQSKTNTVSEPRPIVINIHGNVVDQDAFARELIPSIRKAIDDGMRI